LISPIYVGPESIKIDWPVAMGSSLVLFIIAREGFINALEGTIFVSSLVIYIVFLIVHSRKKNTKPKNLDKLSSETVHEVNPTKKTIKHLLLIVLGCAGLFYGSDWFVGGAQNIAINLGVSERIVGITILALGTSLPELTTAIIASIKKETDLALGNLLGSNIFNILSILGITSIITEIQVSELIVDVDMIWMLGITFLILPFMLTGKHVERWEGILLLVVYCYYVYSVIV